LAQNPGHKPWRLPSASQTDFIDGGADFDTLRYDFVDAGLHAYLYDTAQNTGFAAGDTLVSIEGIVGSYHSDDLRGDAGVNVIQALNGDDFIIGLGGGDLLLGGNVQDLFLYVSTADGGSGWNWCRNQAIARCFASRCNAGLHRYFGVVSSFLFGNPVINAYLKCVCRVPYGTS
jgi:hypothetical protein